MHFPIGAWSVRIQPTRKLAYLYAGTVSAKPIVMRAEYAYCPNLTIIDTPGFILKARPCLHAAHNSGMHSAVYST